MKIKKEDIDRIISILNNKKKELNEEESFIFKSDNLKYLEKQFQIPKNYYLPLAKNEYEADIIYDFIVNRINKENKGSWKKEHVYQYHLVVSGGIYETGHRTPIQNYKYKNYIKVSFEDFEKYIYNKK